jgi:hypothetical protein
VPVVSTARYLIGDVFDVLATLPAGSVDCVITSPPYMQLRSYLPPDHPDKHRELGQQDSPAEFIEALLCVMDALWPVLTDDGTFWIVLGDTHVGSGGAGGDYNPGGLREGQQRFDGTARKARRTGGTDASEPRRRQPPQPTTRPRTPTALHPCPGDRHRCHRRVDNLRLCGHRRPPLVVAARSSEPPEGLRRYLRESLTPDVDVDPDHGCERWLNRWVLALGELNRRNLAEANRQLGKRDDGKQAKFETSRRYRRTAKACVRRAFELEYIAIDPWPPAQRGRSRRKINRVDLAVDVKRLHARQPPSSG